MRIKGIIPMGKKRALLLKPKKVVTLGAGGIV
jgi:hypothetical protein